MSMILGIYNLLKSHLQIISKKKVHKICLIEIASYLCAVNIINHHKNNEVNAKRQ